MNIEINLLPEELRPRPLVETRTLLLIVVIVALAAGCAFLVQSRASTDGDIEDLEQRITAINQEMASISSDPEALALTNSINALKAMKQSYDSFVAARIGWGDAVDRVRNYVPSGVEIRKLTQHGNTLVVDGTATGYGAVASYGRVINMDSKLDLAALPSISANTYALVVRVAPGGGG